MRGGVEFTPRVASFWNPDGQYRGPRSGAWQVPLGQFAQDLAEQVDRQVQQGYNLLFQVQDLERRVRRLEGGAESPEYYPGSQEERDMGLETQTPGKPKAK